MIEKGVGDHIKARGALVDFEEHRSRCFGGPYFHVFQRSSPRAIALRRMGLCCNLESKESAFGKDLDVPACLKVV